MKSKIVIQMLCICMCVILCGCGNQIPDMSAEEQEQVVDYAAALLLKYDKDNDSRLMSLDEVNAIVEKEEAKREKARQRELLQAQEEARERQAAADAAQNDALNSASGEAEGQATESVSDISNVYIEEALGIAGVHFAYNGYEFTDSYSPSEGDSFFAMTATTGKKLLIIYMDAQNNSGGDLSLNMADVSAKIRLSINGSENRPALTTMLPNDFCFYNGTIAGGSSERLSIVAEVDENQAMAVDSIVVTFKGGNGTIKAMLH